MSCCWDTQAGKARAGSATEQAKTRKTPLVSLPVLVLTVCDGSPLDCALTANTKSLGTACWNAFENSSGLDLCSMAKSDAGRPKISYTQPKQR